MSESSEVQARPERPSPPGSRQWECQSQSARARPSGERRSPPSFATKWSGRHLELSGAANETACEADLVSRRHTLGRRRPASAPSPDSSRARSSSPWRTPSSKVGDEHRGPRAAARLDQRRRAAGGPGALVAGRLPSPAGTRPGRPGQPLDADVLVCSDHPEATRAADRARPTASRAVAASTPARSRRRRRSRPSPPC